MPKLSAYVFISPNASYRFKRNVPKRLTHLIGKDSFSRQLGESYSEAMKALPKVHSEIEALFEAEETMPANDMALALIMAVLVRKWQNRSARCRWLSIAMKIMR